MLKEMLQCSTTHNNTSVKSLFPTKVTRLPINSLSTFNDTEPRISNRYKTGVNVVYSPSTNVLPTMLNIYLDGNGYNHDDLTHIRLSHIRLGRSWPSLIGSRITQLDTETLLLLVENNIFQMWEWKGVVWGKWGEMSERKTQNTGNS